MKQPASAFHEASSAPTAGLMDAIRKTDYLIAPTRFYRAKPAS
jgi:hypothetical protein